MDRDRRGRHPAHSESRQITPERGATGLFTLTCLSSILRDRTALSILEVSTLEIRLFQSVAALSSIALTAIVIELIRRRRLKDELWLPWLVVAIAPLIAGLWISPWAALARGLGIQYEPALLLGFAILMCFALLLYLTVVVSGLMRQNLRLAQELGILRLQLDPVANRDSKTGTVSQPGSDAP